MVLVSPFFMLLVSPPTEYCYFDGFTTSRGPEIRALKCRTDKRRSQKTRCSENAPRNKNKVKKRKKEKRRKREKNREKEKKEKKKKRKNGKEGGEKPTIY